MYAIGYFYGPWEDGSGGGSDSGGSGTGTGTGLTNEQKALLDEMKWFKDEAAQSRSEPLGQLLYNMMDDSAGAAFYSEPVYWWWTNAVPDVFKKQAGDPDSSRAKAYWESLLTRSHVQTNALAAASNANPDNVILTVGDLLPLEAWRVQTDTWRGTTDTWRAAIDQWKSDTNAEVFDVTETPNTFFCRLRPPNRKVRANALYIVNGTGHYSLTNYELFYFRLLTHGPNQDVLAQKAFQFTVFNNSSTWNCRVTCNNNSTLQPVLFVRGQTVSKSVGNSIIGPRQGVRFTFVPLAFSTYQKDGRTCPAFIEEDVFINTSQTLLPPNNLNYDFTGVEASLPP